MGGVPQGGEDLPCDIAFEAKDGLGLAHTLGGATAHVRLGPFIMTKSDNHNAMECSIVLAATKFW